MRILENAPVLTSGKPLILYELNEVPWRVIDWYVRLRPSSAFARLQQSATTHTTVTRDEGELHPWTTWPSLHRGVYNSRHNIRFINQDLSAANAWPPVWETVKAAGKRVGVFGSLQSYPAQQGYAFYVPDTFSPGCGTMPPAYSAFQRFNLRQTQQDGAQASPLKFDSSVASDVLNMMRVGLRMATCSTIARHVLKERVNPLYRSRRSVLQGVVAFDIFRHALRTTRPDFCTFFTNHVAGMMHRYWKQTFPEDFGAGPSTPADRFHAGSIACAMDIADAQLGWMMAYVDANGGMLMLASSMGQEAIDRGEYVGEWRITDMKKFWSAMAWHAPVQNLLAMQPDFNFSFASAVDAEEFLRAAACLTDAGGLCIWKRMQRMGASVNLGLSPSRQAIYSGEVTVATPGAAPRTLKIADMGIELLRRDPGTGYHQPYGVLLSYGAGIACDDSRREVESTEVRPAILRLMGVTESQAEASLAA
jgi:hypothetical protein